MPDTETPIWQGWDESALLEVAEQLVGFPSDAHHYIGPSGL